MSQKRYSRDHEWVELNGDTATIGISTYAVSELGDIIFVELPEVGTELGAGDKLAVVESVKAASDVYAPIAGVVAEVNDALADESAMLNEDPEGGAWIARLTVNDASDFDALMSKIEYEAYLKEAGH
ncbi:MAG: Glycine cleavage system H protein [Firmicutes bacterium ADurb.Bin506]|jgi:glycine cleavage system H protein|nr:MAG: Glycine cleavage system H protein [Firmicutes bacterium ADurb.Bin506]